MKCSFGRVRLISQVWIKVRLSVYVLDVGTVEEQHISAEGYRIRESSSHLNGTWCVLDMYVGNIHGIRVLEKQLTTEQI